MSKKKKTWQWTKSPTAKRLFSWCRWLHVYISSALFSLLIFFSITGITLNHPDWVDQPVDTKEATLLISTALQQKLARQELAAVAELEASITSETGLSKPRSIETAWDMGEINFDYPLPAGYAFATLDIGSGELIIESQKGGVGSLLNDLHKGRHSGSYWSLIIDVSAALICLFAISGVILLLQHKRFRAKGLLTVIGGAIMPVALYFWLVPTYSL